MPRNEDGEFELVVGNTQLLSIVFVLMVVFGLVFCMGYFVGRANSGGDNPTPVAQQAANQPAGRPQAAGAEGAATPATEATPDDTLPAGAAKVTTRETGASTTPVASATPVAAHVSAATPKPVATLPPAPTTPVAAVQAGQTFLQVAAVKKPQADMLVELLKDKGFHALSSETAPGAELYRTLVGPLRDAAELAKTKADLENAGFKPIVKRF
ncbi:MAG TPA: SPOR domain-containing protein [Bryobacteraceae bacterium]|nr:SPOR domain-containing protein [Bryobacteraceae bacterium]